MKKLILIFAAFLMCAAVYSQRNVVTDSIRCPAADTIVYVRMFTGAAWGIMFDNTNLDAANGIINLYNCETNDSILMSQIDHDELPYTAVDDAKAFEKNRLMFPYLGIRLTGSGNTEGLYVIYKIYRQ